MKILIVTPTFYPTLSGVSSFVNNLVENWPSDDQFVIYTPHAKGDKNYDKDNSIRIYRGKIEGLSGMIKIRSIVKKEGIERVHLHAPHFLTRITQYIFVKFVKCRYKIFFHSVDFNFFKSDSKKKNRVTRLIKNADKVIVNSNYLKDRFSKIFGAIVKDIVVVYPCPSHHFYRKVDVEKTSVLKKKLALEGKRVIITVARLDEGKGYPRLIKALPAVLKKFPNFVWLIVGDGKKRKEFIDLISKYGMQNIIRYIGVVDHKELVNYYQLADLFVLLIHPDEEAEEDWATVFLEASASGLPIITGRVGGIDEQVHELKTGVIVDPDNKQEASSAIIDLLTDKDKAKAMGNYGKIWVKKVFDWKIQIEKILT